jgi:hypothetical protein
MGNYYNWHEKDETTEDWRDRVYKERHELELRIQKLNQFLRSIKKRRPNEPEFDGFELKLLMEQLRCMEAYHDALTDRIFNFEVFDEAE